MTFLCSCFLSCNKPLTIYSDPWLKGYTLEMKAAYEELYPGRWVEVRFLSSELVAWHIRYGQPIDVFVCMGPEVLDSLGLRGRVKREVVLADEGMALVEVVGANQEAYFRTEGCIGFEGTHRPGRRWAEQWLANSSLVSGGCKVYAGFQSQMEDYLLRGWIKQGIVPGAFARRHPERLRILAQGPVHEGGYVALDVSDGKDKWVVDFLELLRSEKSLEVLAKEGLIR